jgi:hypothetical protein
MHFSVLKLDHIHKWLFVRTGYLFVWFSRLHSVLLSGGVSSGAFVGWSAAWDIRSSLASHRENGNLRGGERTRAE